MSKNRLVHSLSSLRLPTSSMMRQEGFTMELTTDSALFSAIAFSSLALSSVAFR